MHSPTTANEHRNRKRWSIYEYISRGVAWLASVIPQLPCEVKLDARLRRATRAAPTQTLTHRDFAGGKGLTELGDESGDHSKIEDLNEAFANLDEVKLPTPLPLHDDHSTLSPISEEEYTAVRPPEFDALTSDIARGTPEPSPTPLDLEYIEDPEFVSEPIHETDAERFTSADLQKDHHLAQGQPHRTPRGAQRIKLRDPNKKSKRRRKRSSRRDKQGQRDTPSPQSVHAAPETPHLSPDATQPRAPQPEPELEYSNRPPLRSASPPFWEGPCTSYRHRASC